MIVDSLIALKRKNIGNHDEMRYFQKSTSYIVNILLKNSMDFIVSIKSQRLYLRTRQRLEIIIEIIIASLIGIGIEHI